ncbi:MAG TPA: metalloregulator ArsR/SmtB family transcription factor [Anaerolineales bacterium]|nr:metalloregulator ArsR/SmtB family transcription factor [Anaerolineales bacterium]
MNQAEMLSFFKALADANRLKIVGLLARQSYSVEELAALLDLKASTISHHLSRLSEAGLVTARAEGYYSVYQLDEPALEAFARSLFSPGQISVAAEAVDLQAYDRKVLAAFSLPDGSLKEIPAQRKKLEAVLRYVAKAFQPGVKYPEKQVNEILSRFHPDTATLRRELVGNGLMKRAGGGGDYWLAGEQSTGDEQR